MTTTIADWIVPELTIDTLTARLTDTPIHVLATAPGWTEVFALFVKMEDAFEGHDVSTRRTAGRERITFPNGSIITFVSRRSAARRGHSADIVIIDRHATDDQLHDLLPTLAVTGGQMIDLVWS